MPTFTEYQIEYRPWVVLSQISGQPTISEADFELAKEVFLNADASTRAGWIATDYVGERLAVRLMEQANKVELNRIGKILLTWRKPYGPGLAGGLFHRRSETLLRSAIQRCAQSGGNKLFAAQLCAELRYTPLYAELRTDTPEVLDRIVSRALGGETFTYNIGNVGDDKTTSAVADMYRAVHGLNETETDRLILTCPASSTLTADDWSHHIGRSGRDYTPERLLRTLHQHHYGEEGFSTISKIVSDNPDIVREKAAQYLPDDKLRLPLSWYAEEDQHLDVLLGLFREGYSNSVLSWTCELWASTRSRPSEGATVGALFSQPKLLPLMLSGPRDGSWDSQMVMAGTFAASRLAEDGQLEPFCEGMPPWAYMSAMRILSNIVVSDELRYWMVEKTPGLKRHLQAGYFQANKA